MRGLLRWICLGLLAVVPSAACSDTNPPSRTYDFSAVDSAVADFMEAYGVSGLTLAVVHRDDGQILGKGYGDFQRGRMSLIASTSKVLSAGLILSLVDEGLLELDRPVAEYLDWGDYHPTVTMRLLLSMMSGLPGLPDQERPCVIDPAASLRGCGRAVFQDESGSVPPGEVFRYSGDAWQLAGAVAEVVSGKSWSQLLEEKLVSPCGLANTDYRSLDSADGYPATVDGDPSVIPHSDNPKIGGGAYTTVADYGKVLLMHLRDGRCGQERVLSPDMVQAMQDALVPEGVSLPEWRPEALNYGMGWWWFEEDPPLFVDSGRFGARSVLHPEEGWGAILIIELNTVIGSLMYRDIVPHIREAVLEAN